MIRSSSPEFLGVYPECVGGIDSVAWDGAGISRVSLTGQNKTLYSNMLVASHAVYTDISPECGHDAVARIYPCFRLDGCLRNRSAQRSYCFASEAQSHQL